ncbi:hypothetical protein ABDK00_008765 [Niabella insulamsoli]|uniref:hypothetical protein n=1 Tax=Niabella insulamsoli TaxID=3144874 RepID=UPI0031FDF088
MLHYFADAQCTVTQCLGNGTSFSYTPIKFFSSVAIYDRRIDRSSSGLQGETTDGILFTAVQRGAGCITENGVSVPVDAVVTVRWWNKPAATVEPTTLGSLTRSTDASYSNSLLFAGGGYERIYRIQTDFFRGDGQRYSTTTFSGGTPIALNALQQINDIDGDGINDASTAYTDPRANAPFATNPVVEGGGYRDDFVWTAGFYTAHYSVPTLIYTKTTRPADNSYNGSNYINPLAWDRMPTTGYTYFFSSGIDNYNYSAIQGVPASPATTNIVLSWSNRTWDAFYYYPGNFNGIYIDFTGENNKFNTCVFPVSGNVFNDVNANTRIDGDEASGKNPAADNDLYIYLIDEAGKVANFSKVNSNGSYSMDASSNSTYTLRLSTMANQPVGSNASAITTTAPANWHLTGENGTDNTGSGDGTIDGNLTVHIGTAGVTHQNFGLAEGTTLPVTMGAMSASLTEGILSVKWTTLSETNNDHFDIEASTDGVEFTKIGSLRSKSNGVNSSGPLNYEFSIAVGNALMGGFSILLLVTGLFFRRKVNVLSLAVFGLSCGLFFISCTKNDSSVPIDNNKTIYVRVAEVSKDGEVAYFNIIKAEQKK